MPRKQSNALRTVKGEGRKVNVETGVEIVKVFGGYEIRIPALVDAGYYVAATVLDTLAVARELAVVFMDATRLQQDNDHGKALAEANAEHLRVVEATLAEIAEVAATIPADAAKPLHTLAFLAKTSAEGGFIDAARERLGRLRDMLSGRTVVISDSEAEAARVNAQALIGTVRRSTLGHDEAGRVIKAYIEAESNRVVLSIKYARGYGSRYASDTEAV